MSNTQIAAAHGGNLVPLADIQQAADMVAKSGLFGVKNKEEAATLMLVAQSEGSHFMNALREFHVISGKPSLKADAILARFQAAGGTVKWSERTDTVCKASFFHQQGGEVSITWTLDMAKNAGYTEKNPNWKKVPRQMLTARVISEGVRTVFPKCLNGFYTPEEVQDFEPPAAPEARPMPAEAEVMSAAQNPEPSARQADAEPDFTVGIGGASSPAEAPAAPPAWEANLRSWLNELCGKHGQAKVMAIAAKYCPAGKIGSLSPCQVERLRLELSSAFNEYAPEFFEEDC